MTPARDAGGAATEAMVHAAYAAWVRRNGSARISEATIRAMLDAALALGTAQPDAEALRKEVERLRAEMAEWMALVTAVNAYAAKLQVRLATSDAPCPYCALPADRMAECARGIPGCARADDMGADGIDSASAPDIERAAADDPLPDVLDKQSSVSLSESTADLALSNNGLAPKNSGQVTAPDPGLAPAADTGEGNA